MRVSTDCMPSWAKNVPLRAPALPAQFSDCSPRTAGPQPHDVLRLALRRGEASEGGRSPPPSFLGEPSPPKALTDAPRAGRARRSPAPPGQPRRLRRRAAELPGRLGLSANTARATE